MAFTPLSFLIEHIMFSFGGLGCEAVACFSKKKSTSFRDELKKDGSDTIRFL